MIESDLIYSSDVIEKAINSKIKKLALVSPYKIGMDGTVVEVLDNKIIGDVNFDEIKDKVKAITPVPGGVGPMTIACLLSNTLKCFKAH